MRKLLAGLAAGSLISTLFVAGAAPAHADDCSKPSEVVSSSISPRTVVLGVSAFKGIVVTAKIRANGCRLSGVDVGLYGPNFVDTYDLVLVGTKDGITTYDTGLRISPGDLANSEAGAWKSYVTIYGETPTGAPGPNWKVLRAARLTVNATPEPVKKGRTLTIRGDLQRASWDSLTYRGYGRRTVDLQFRTPKGAYATLKKMKTATDGSIKTTVKASADGCYRYVFSGSSTTGSARAAGDCVDVR